MGEQLVCDHCGKIWHSLAKVAMCCDPISNDLDDNPDIIRSID